MSYYVFSDANSIKNPTQTQVCPGATQIQQRADTRPLFLHNTKKQSKFRCYL